ncbi:MAG: hypothetical protein Q9180_000233 [Flavoplaca navasiana]
MSTKRRQPAAESNSSARPPARPAKRQQTKQNTDSGPTGGNERAIEGHRSQKSSSMDRQDGFWTSGLAFNELLDNLNDAQAAAPQEPERRTGATSDALQCLSPLRETQRTPPSSTTTAMSIINDDNFNDFIKTPPSTTGIPTGTPTDSSVHLNRGCECFQSLAGILQKIGGDSGNESDEVDRFDILLVHLRDGVETCSRVLPCKQCSIPTTNSMFIVTIVQQLATISQDLCSQLLNYQHRVKDRTASTPTSTSTSTSSIDTLPPPLNAEIHVGNYQVRPAALCLGIMFPVVRVYLKDLDVLLARLRDSIKKGTKAFRLLGTASETSKRASEDWQMALIGQRVDKRKDG